MKTQCPNCKARFSTSDASAGKKAKCPKCGNPFTIEPLTETPPAAKPPAKSPEPAAPPVKNPETVEPPVKSESPVEAPVESPKPAEPPPPPEPQAESPQAEETPVTKAEPVEPPPESPEPVVHPATVEPPVKSDVPVEAPPKSEEPVKEEKPESKAVSKKISKLVFVFCWAIVRIIAGTAGALGLMLALRKEAHSTLIATFAAADAFLLLSVLIELALFYKMWAAIGDSEASVSPAKAVGFLFIPVFNIYWALLMVTGFVEDYNSFIQRRSVKTRDLPMSLFLIYAFAFILSATVVTTPMICVFAFVGLIHRVFSVYTDLSWALVFIASAAGIVHFLTYILFATKTCNAINALPERKSR